MAKLMHININVTRNGSLFDARVDGQSKVICRSRQPFFDAARTLARLALADPDAILVMRHAGSEAVALKGKIMLAAKLSVCERSEGGLRFEKWQPSQAAEGLGN